MGGVLPVILDPEAPPQRLWQHCGGAVFHRINQVPRWRVKILFESLCAVSEAFDMILEIFTLHLADFTINLRQAVLL